MEISDPEKWFLALALLVNVTFTMGCGVGFGVPFWLGSVFRGWKNYLYIFVHLEICLLLSIAGLSSPLSRYSTSVRDKVLELLATWIIFSVLFWAGLGIFLLFVWWEIARNGLPRRDQLLGV